MNATTHASTPSGYQDGATLGAIVEARVEDLLAGIRERSVSGEDVYGFTQRQAVTFTLAGGGPAADVTLVFESTEFDDGLDPEDVVEGWYSYYEPSGTACVYLSRATAAEIATGLLRDPEEPVDDDK